MTFQSKNSWKYTLKTNSNNRNGFGILHETNNFNGNLGKDTNPKHAGVTALLICCSLVAGNVQHQNHLMIVSDSESAVRALQDHKVKSKMQLECIDAGSSYFRYVKSVMKLRDVNENKMDKKISAMLDRLYENCTSKVNCDKIIWETGFRIMNKLLDQKISLNQIEREVQCTKIVWEISEIRNNKRFFAQIIDAQNFFELLPILDENHFPQLIRIIGNLVWPFPDAKEIDFCFRQMSHIRNADGTLMIPLNENKVRELMNSYDAKQMNN